MTFENVTTNEVTITLKNKNVLTSDDVLGACTVDLIRAKKEGQEQVATSVKYNGKTKGELHLDLTWKGPRVSQFHGLCRCCGFCCCQFTCRSGCRAPTASLT